MVANLFVVVVDGPAPIVKYGDCEGGLRGSSFVSISPGGGDSVSSRSGERILCGGGCSRAREAARAGIGLTGRGGMGAGAGIDAARVLLGGAFSSSFSSWFCLASSSGGFGILLFAQSRSSY